MKAAFLTFCRVSDFIAELTCLDSNTPILKLRLISRETGKLEKLKSIKSEAKITGQRKLTKS
jgi:hypothetical protein